LESEQFGPILGHNVETEPEFVCFVFNLANKSSRDNFYKSSTRDFSLPISVFPFSSARIPIFQFRQPLIDCVGRSLCAVQLLEGHRVVDPSRAFQVLENFANENGRWWMVG